MKRRVFWLFTLILVAGVVSGCSAPATPAATEAPTAAPTPTAMPAQPTAVIPAESPDDTWPLLYGEPGANETAAGVLPADGGGYFIVGSTDRGDQGHVYLGRTDANGQLLWENTYGGEQLDEISSVIQADDGSLVLAGWTTSSGEEGNDVYLLGIDPDGNELWSSTFGGPKNEMVPTIVPAADGGYFVVGNLVDPDDFVTDPGVAGYAGFSHRSSIFVAKTDAEGNELWSRSYDNGMNVYTPSAVQTPDGGVLVLATILLFPDSDSDIYFLRVDEAGDVVWTRTWEQGRAMGAELIQSSDGNYVATGSYTSLEGDGSLPSDFLFLTIDPAGNEVWSSVYGDSNMAEFSHVLAETADGGYVAVGVRMPPRSRDFDILVVAIDASGEPVGEQSIEMGGYVRITDILPRVDGGYVIAGYTQSGRTFDILLARIDDVYGALE